MVYKKKWDGLSYVGVMGVLCFLFVFVAGCRCHTSVFHLFGGIFTIKLAPWFFGRRAAVMYIIILAFLGIYQQNIYLFPVRIEADGERTKY
jgi:hypothetical protein